MGIRTPDLLHAMERRTVHRNPRQFTRDPAELAFRPEQVTSVHESSLRTVTSLVTSPTNCRPKSQQSSNYSFTESALSPASLD